MPTAPDALPGMRKAMAQTARTTIRPLVTVVPLLMGPVAGTGSANLVGRHRFRVRAGPARGGAGRAHRVGSPPLRGAGGPGSAGAAGGVSLGGSSGGVTGGASGVVVVG